MRAKFGSGKIIALVFDIVILAFLLLWLNSTETGLSPAVLIICVVIFLFYAFSMVLKPKRIWRGIPTILTAELGFSLFYFVLFYLAYVRDLLGLSPYWKNSMISHTFPEGANQAILLATIGFVAFHAGTLLFPAQAYRYSSTEMESQNNSYPLFDAILTVVQIMLSACFWIFGLRSSDIDRYGISDRAQAVQIQASSAVGGNAIVDGLYLLTLVCCFLSISRVVYSLALQRRLSRLQLVMAVNVVAWAMYILLSGDRNNFLLIALAGAGGIAAFVRRINWTAIFIFIAGALFMYQTIEVTRQMRDASFSEFISALTDSASGDEERSSSFDGTGLGLRATFSVAPNPVAFAYGYYKFVGIAGIVPMSRQLIIKPGARFTNSSEVLTYYIIGPYAGWSVGSNILSDIYLDFGTIGVVLMMGMIGWFVAWSRGAIVTHGLSMKRIFIYVATLAYVGELPRYTFDAPVRLLVWGIILISLYELVFLRRGRKKSFAKNEEDEVSKTPGTSSLP